MKSVHFALWACLASVSLLEITDGGSALGAGDLVFVAAASDAPDTFAFVPLVHLAAGTVVHFTDNARTGTGTGFADWRRAAGGGFSEGPVYTWMAPAAVAAGTRVTVTDTDHRMQLATGGDNLLAFQGDIYQPQFIAGIGWSVTDSFIESGSPTANNSYLPLTLTLAGTAVEIGSAADNVAYGGPTTGTAAQLRGAVNLATNWLGNDSTVLAGPSGLAVTDPATAAVAALESAGYGFGPDAAGYTDAASLVASGTTMSAFRYAGSGVKDADGTTGMVGQAFAVAGGWSTGAFSPNGPYCGFTLTVDPGLEFLLEDFGFSYQSSANMSLAAYFSGDGFASYRQIGPEVVVSDALVRASWGGGYDFGARTGALEFRIYGYNAANAGATLRLDEVWLRGMATAPAESFGDGGGALAVPEPTNGLAAAWVLGALWLRRRLRR